MEQIENVQLPSSWMGFKVVDQAVVDAQAAAVLPSAQSLAGRVHLVLQKDDGSQYLVAAAVVAVTFTFQKMKYSLAVAIAPQPREGVTLYAVIDDVPSEQVVALADGAAALDSVGEDAAPSLQFAAPARIAFDSAIGEGGVLARLKLVGELARIKVGLKNAGDGPAGALARLKLIARANQVRQELGAAAQDQPPAPAAVEPADEPVVGEDGQAVAAPAEDEPETQPISDDPNSPHYRYRDTGYIANSRKEQAASLIAVARKSGTRLRASDIDFDAIEQNPRLAKDTIIKANLFGKTDWDALQAAGMDPAAGFLIDKIYSSIAAEPAADNPAARRDYAIGLESIRDRLQDVKSVKDVLAALGEIRDELDGATLQPDEAEQYELLSEQIMDLVEQRGQLDNSSSATYEAAQGASSDASALEHQIGQRKRRGWDVSADLQQSLIAAKARADALWSEFGEIRARVNPQIEALRSQVSDLINQRDAVKKAAVVRNLVQNQTTRSWLTFGERFFKLVHYRNFKGSETFAGHVTNASAGRVTDWSWADKERPAQPKAATKQEVNFQLRVADTFERRGGAPVTATSTQALKDMLGLRDVQSGNWVLKDPNSAKFHVEQTAMAMSDLSDLLEIDVAALGLGGRLGLAFGARGTGGKNAARAHYEPVHRVVNLTKMGGGGCLGHEMFHAVDNMLPELVKQEAAGKKNDFASINPDLLPAGPIQDAMRNLRSVMIDGPHRLPQQIVFTDREIRLAHANIDAPRNAIARAIKDAGTAEAAVLAVDGYFGTGKPLNKNAKTWRILAAAFYAQPGETGAVLKTGRAVSSFMKEAVLLDGGSGDKYWSTPDELAARGFQAWIEDKMASLDRRNDYLSIFADNKFHVDPLFGIEWKPYPEGEERQRINAAFEQLFAAIREAKVFEQATANKPLLDSIFGAGSNDDVVATPAAA
ncbi:MAG: hypothetical protein GAK28_04800 [Luteibacter sp.]|uniref:LPD1 domain-containing protein n=1 Tax=Luteibacter sp. TaxID=1886636 RepID=UPI001380102E|nr:LPD1 domain-containing protein [Luteibacter sp.]KAF1003295.1 MAG: hypothetical protein GAK28_04800 [Luteibacter sp.]